MALEILSHKENSYRMTKGCAERSIGKRTWSERSSTTTVVLGRLGCRSLQQENTGCFIQALPWASLIGFLNQLTLGYNTAWADEHNTVFKKLPSLQQSFLVHVCGGVSH